MKVYLKIAILFIFLKMNVFGAIEHQGVDYLDENKFELIGSQIYYFQDSTNSLTFEHVRTSATFIKNETQVPSYGVNNSTHWLRFDVVNNTDAPTLMLEIEFPELDQVSFFRQSGLTEEYFETATGQSTKIKDRDINHQYYIFDLKLKPNESGRFYLKIKSNEDILVPLKIGAERIMFEKLLIQDFIFGIYFGLMLIMLFYNLGVYFVVKDSSYLYYILYILFVALVQACFLGYGFKYVWNDSLWMSKNMLYISGVGSGLFVLLFANNFLDLRRNTPKLIYGAYFLSTLYLIALVLSLVGYKQIAFNLINFTALLVSFYLIWVCILLSIKGNRPAKFFLLAWSGFFIGVIIFVLRNFGVLPYNGFTYYILQISSSIGIFLLSLALADKIKIYKAQKEEAQRSELRELIKNKELVVKHNSELEKKVDERTESLNLLNLELAKKNNEKSAIIKEIHHRVKNNLQIVNSLLRLQSHEVEDEGIVKLFEECQNRVVSMAMLHEKMYRSDDLKKIDVKDHFTLLAEDLIKTYNVRKNIILDIKIDDIDIDMKTLVPLGLIINEMISNSLKHAFNNESKGKLTVHLFQRETDKYQLIIGDDGIGRTEKDEKKKTFGNELIEIFNEQIEGVLTRMNKPGTFYSIIFNKIG